MRAASILLAAAAGLAPLTCGDAGGVGDAGSSVSPTSTGDAPEPTTAAASTAAGDPVDPTTGPVPSTSTGDTTGDVTTDVTTTDGTTTDGTTTDTTGTPAGPVPLRVLAINAGNASPQFGCFEYKLCRAEDIANLAEYLAAWQPDVVMISEVLRAAQLAELLPPGYAGRCGESRDRHTGEPAAWDAADASHEHECVAWRTARASYVEGSARSAYGRNDELGKADCNYDFTGFRVQLLVDGAHPLTAVAVHPDSQSADCRTEEISRIWSELADGPWVVIGGDWNTESDAELQRPPDARIAYLRGEHWDLAVHGDEWSAEYAFGLQKKKFDHAFVRGPAAPCTDCGALYGSPSLAFGSALGGHDDHPRADAGDGMDHRQILLDLYLQP